jgi:hypothetical protein
MDNRYQFQPWYIKLYRRAKYFPRFILNNICDYYKWVVGGFKIIRCDGYEKLPLCVQKRFFSRYNTFVSIYRMNLSLYDIDIKYYHTTKELLETIRNGRD